MYGYVAAREQVASRVTGGQVLSVLSRAGSNGAGGGAGPTQTARASLLKRAGARPAEARSLTLPQTRAIAGNITLRACPSDIPSNTNQAQHCWSVCLCALASWEPRGGTLPATPSRSSATPRRLVTVVSWCRRWPRGRGKPLFLSISSRPLGPSPPWSFHLVGGASEAMNRGEGSAAPVAVDASARAGARDWERLGGGSR